MSKKYLQEHVILPLWTVVLIMGTELAAAPWMEWKFCIHVSVRFVTEKIG